MSDDHLLPEGITLLKSWCLCPYPNAMQPLSKMDFEKLCELIERLQDRDDPLSEYCYHLILIAAFKFEHLGSQNQFAKLQNYFYQLNPELCQGVEQTIKNLYPTSKNNFVCA